MVLFGGVLPLDYLLGVPVCEGEECRHVEHDFSPLIPGEHRVAPSLAIHRI